MTQERASREEAILTRLTDDGTLTVASMAEKLGVSEVTIRGDLRALEQRGMLVRTRGGARPSSFKTILQREKVNVEAKQRIAAFAASMITDGDTVMMEAGTTVASITGHLAQRRGVLEGEDAGKGKVHAQVERRPCHLERFGEAVHDAADRLCSFFPQQAQDILRGIAVMHHQRLATFARGTDMGTEAVALPFGLILVPVVI